MLGVLYPKLEDLYRGIHQNPELSFQESRTAGVLAAELRSLGFSVTEKVGRTGVVGVLENGPGPTVLVRTEMDALPMRESTGLPYTSTRQFEIDGQLEFAAHSCGHDVHMACWAGAANVMAATEDKWRGRLVFVAQPSEETLEGARAMMDDGLYERFGKPDYALALHTAPEPIGVYWRSGVASSASDSFEITFHGKPGPCSPPAVDPVAMASKFVLNVQSLANGEKDPRRFGVVTVGAVRAGTTGSFIPDHATVKGTIREYDPTVRDKLLQGIRRTARGVAAISDAPEPDVVLGGRWESVRNDPQLADRLGRLFTREFGGHAVEARAPLTAGEDFQEFVAGGVRSCFFNIGVYKPSAISMPVNHDPAFAPEPEQSIRLGVEAMSLAITDLLA